MLVSCSPHSRVLLVFKQFRPVSAQRKTRWILIATSRKWTLFFCTWEIPFSGGHPYACLCMFSAPVDTSLSLSPTATQYAAVTALVDTKQLHSISVQTVLYFKNNFARFSSDVSGNWWRHIRLSIPVHKHFISHLDHSERRREKMADTHDFGTY